jgi:hypothetical protein
LLNVCGDKFPLTALTRRELQSAKTLGVAVPE